ncbi:hypothetical protein [Streptomyces sp. NPDC051636]|uniref:hypothetical protein n=1 Tax=Streptomyces sp. NPDC051636 TaxID=3365663 RepID=UPI00378C863A
MLNPALLQHALSVTSVDRLIFSTDYPFQRPTREEIDSFLNHFSSDTERQQFSSANAAFLYGIDLQTSISLEDAAEGDAEGVASPFAEAAALALPGRQP